MAGNLQALLRQMARRLDALATRGAVELVNDKLKTQRLQLTILADEVADDVEHMQPYGLSFVPPAGSECLAVALGGVRDVTVAVCVQHPDERPTGKEPRSGGLYTSGKWRVFVDAEGTVCVGSDESSEHILLGDLLVSLLGQLTVPTAMGPSGTPINAAAFKQALSKHKVAP